MLDNSTKEQLRGIFDALKSEYTFDIELAPSHDNRDELIELLGDVAECSDKISLIERVGDNLSFTILKDNNPTGIIFRAVPNGHEFNSLLLAILNADGVGKNFPDEFTIKRIKALKTPIKLSTYMMLTCTKCPDVVQALNIMSIYNEGITHEAVDGNIYLEEARALNVHAVPAVYADGEQIHVGRSSLGELLDKLEEKYGSANEVVSTEVQEYEFIILGGGPAGATAAIYAARKGIKVAVIAGKIGGQVNDTVDIENISSILRTTGESFASDLREHMKAYDVHIYENRQIESFEVIDGVKTVKVKGGEQYSAPIIIIATGAKWRKLNVPGEEQYLGRGISFCPHCDGPFFKDKKVAVIGGGNSGIEVAIDLSRICSEVVVIEYMEELKADKVLQDKARETPNIEIITNTETVKIRGDKKKVTSLVCRNRSTGTEEEMELSGIFIQVGLEPNSSLFEGSVEVNKRGEIVVDKDGRTSAKGIYAIDDVTDVSYKQIVISMGEGAKGSLAAFDDMIRGEI